MDHDRLFKELLRVFFVDFLDLFFPEVLAYVDRDSIEFLDKEIFTDLASADRHEVELVVKAKFRGMPTCFLIHVEAQAGRQKDFPKRLFRYFARLFEKYDLPVYPIVIFSYDSPQTPEPESLEIDFPDRRVLAFNYRVVQLNRLNWRDYVRRQNPVAAALMTKMKIAAEDRPRVKLEILRMMVTLKLDPARQTLIHEFMAAYLKLSAAEMQVYNAASADIIPPEREAIVRIVSEWEEMGAQRIVLRQLRRLGPMSASLEERVRALPHEKVEELADAIMELHDWTKVMEWLDRESPFAGKT